MYNDIIDFYKNELSLYESEVLNANFMLSEAITTYIESYNESHYISEATDETFWQKVKKFFAKIINTITTGYKSLIIKIDSKFSEVQLDIKLRTMKQDAINNKKKGAKTVEIMPIRDYQKTYMEFHKKLSKFNKKFTTVKYKNVAQIDKDLEAFNDTVKTYSAKLDEIKQQKITIPIDEYIVFLRKEVDKTSDVHKSIKDMTMEVKEMQITAEKFARERSFLGEDIVPAHVGLLKRAATAVANVIKKYSIFFIVAVVFLFA